MTEGVGYVRPTPVFVPITGSEASAAACAARELAAFRRYRLREDGWGRGSFRNPDESVMCGTLGEIAFAKWLSQTLGLDVSPDTTLRIRGDGGKDFVVAGVVIQVKTARASYPDLLVRSDQHATAWTPGGPRVVYVRAHWLPPRLAKDEVGLWGSVTKTPRGVDLCGFVYHERVNFALPVHSERFPGVWNYVVPPERFLPMHDLAAFLSAKAMKESA